MVRSVSVWVVASICAFAIAASAQPAPEPPPVEPTAGSKLFDEGRELAKAGKYAEACAKFEQSYVLDNGVGTELNLADCHEHLGQFAQAWRYFDEASHRSTDNAARAKFAHDRAEALSGKLATAVVNFVDPNVVGISVTIAGRAVKANGVITERVDPGDIAVHVATPSKVLFDATKSAASGATVIFDVPAAAVEEHHEDAPVTDRRHKRLLVSYAIGGVGLAGLVTGIVIGVVADRNYNADTAACVKDAQGQLFCTPEATAKAVSDGALADAGTYVSVIGLAAIAAGVAVYLTAPKDLVVTPMASNQTAGLAISGRF
ncbi:MAG: hypothetical protein ABI591_05785 [Kofleriaceae bacterium]